MVWAGKSDPSERLMAHHARVYEEWAEIARDLIPDWTSDPVDISRATRVFLGMDGLVDVAGGVSPSLEIQGNTQLLKGGGAEWVKMAWAAQDDDTVDGPIAEFMPPDISDGTVYYQIMGVHQGAGVLTLPNEEPWLVVPELRLVWDSGTGTPTAGNCTFKFFLVV